MCLRYDVLVCLVFFFLHLTYYYCLVIDKLEILQNPVSREDLLSALDKAKELFGAIQ